MLKIFMTVLFFANIISCENLDNSTNYQTINANSFDDRFSLSNGIDATTPAGKRLSDSFDIINKNCMGCHTGYHNSWATLNTSQKWIDSGYVESGDAYGSTLLIRMKNLGGNMPKDNPQISEEELDIIVDWIDNI